jgi:hypothetical protein
MGSAVFDARIGSLSDERIFGPSKDYQCACGKYDGKRHEGMICDRCGVKITTTAVRRTRFGHIDFPSDGAQHPFDFSRKLGCFPVMPAVYFESLSGMHLSLLYEELLADKSILAVLIEYITPIAAISIEWEMTDCDVFARALGLTRQYAE